jgi:hypothetical protein
MGPRDSPPVLFALEVWLRKELQASVLQSQSPGSLVLSRVRVEESILILRVPGISKYFHCRRRGPGIVIICVGKVVNFRDTNYLSIATNRNWSRASWQPEPRNK